MVASGAAYPKLIAFDLDYTLWNLWIDTHVTRPLRRNGEDLNKVLDPNNDQVSFFKDVPSILHKLKFLGVIIAACSRTTATDLARDALRLLLLPAIQNDSSSSTKQTQTPIPAIEFFNHLEIYPGSKLTHFKKIHERTGIPYSEMLFFDDEHRNKEVESLGVTFQLVSYDGLTNKIFDKGLNLWRKRHPNINMEPELNGETTCVT